MIQTTKQMLITGLSLVLLGIVACNPATPAPPAETAIPPKLIATVELSLTPLATAILPTSEPTQPASPMPSPTPAPPSLTPTPFVGVFMGDGSVPIILPTSAEGVPAPVNVTLQAATALPHFPTATHSFVITSTALPGVVPGVLNSSSTCPVAVDAAFGNVYALNPALAGAIGCPIAPAQQISIAQQNFERGMMFWREGGNIYALARGSTPGSAQIYWRMIDLWGEGQPESDASLIQPSASVQQPIRGFGLAWRSNTQIQGALGWAVADESGYSGPWQDFTSGVMFTAFDGSIYALIPAVAPPDQGQYLGPLR